MPPLHILHVVQSLDPGGMENVLVRVAERLVERDCVIDVCCLEKDGRLAERFRKIGTVTALGKLPGFRISTMAGLHRVLRRIRPDLVHTHNLGPLIYTSLATWGGKACTILHGEHSQLNAADQTPRRLWQRRLLYHCCRRVHTVSNSLYDHLLTFGFPEKLLTAVVNGVDCEHFLPAVDKVSVRRQHNVPQHGIIMLAVGRFGEHKRQDVLIQVFDHLAPRFPDLNLVLVGAGGPREKAVRDLVYQSSYSHRIHLAGFQADMREWYQLADILVTPSINEGLSNAVLEAMATGLPVLANAACGNADVVRDGIDGWVQDLPDANTLTSVLAELLARPDRLAECGAQARQRVLRDFAFSETVQRYWDLYTDLTQR